MTVRMAGNGLLSSFDLPDRAGSSLGERMRGAVIHSKDHHKSLLTRRHKWRHFMETASSGSRTPSINTGARHERHPASIRHHLPRTPINVHRPKPRRDVRSGTNVHPLVLNRPTG